MDGHRITHMRWNASGDHYHPDEVTFIRPDGSEETTTPDRLPFAVPGYVESEAMGGVVVRSGMCTKCGRNVMTTKS
jgi:hypothetical protein